MSTTSKSTTRSSNNFALEDIDSMFSSKSMKTETAAGPSVTKPTTRSKSIPPKRKRFVDPNEEMMAIKKSMVAALANGMKAIKELNGRCIAELQQELGVTRAHAAAKDEEISMSLKLKKLVDKEVADLKIKLSEAEKKASEKAKTWAIKAILESRLKMVNEAEDPEFDRAEWKVEAWKEALKNMPEDDDEEEDEAVVRKIPKSKASRGKEKLVEDEAVINDEEDAADNDDDDDGAAMKVDEEGETAKDDDAVV